jgi:hypothetical protein
VVTALAADPRKLRRTDVDHHLDGGRILALETLESGWPRRGAAGQDRIEGSSRKNCVGPFARVAVVVIGNIDKLVERR